MKAPTQNQYQNYQKMFDYFNVELFGNRLACCLLVFSEKGSNVLGHFSKDKWNRSTQKVSEINLSPTLLSISTDEEIASTLVHEMVHLEQAIFGKCGTSGYHNKQWEEWMERIGLRPSNTGRPGGKKTGFKMKHYVIKGGMFDIAFNKIPKSYLLPFKTKPKVIKTTRDIKKIKLKYSCKKCGTNVWGKSGLFQICGNCFSVMHVEGDDNNLCTNKINPIAVEVISYFIKEIKSLKAQDEFVIFHFVDAVMIKLAKNNMSSISDLEIVKTMIYRMAALFDAWRESGPICDMYRGQYTLN